MFNTQHCPLFQTKLSVWMRILYSSAPLCLLLPPCKSPCSCCLCTLPSPSMLSPFAQPALTSMHHGHLSAINQCPTAAASIGLVGS